MNQARKQRLDQLLVARGLVATRQRAQALILAGDVIVDGERSDKAGQQYPIDSEIRIRQAADHPYVSRGGVKLEAALRAFQIKIAAEWVGLDVGASTGGFTDVLLRAGVRRVHAIDVGHNQMDWKLRNDPRVILQERVNARTLRFDDVGELVDIIVMDVSFISVEKVIPALLQFAKPAETQWVVLIKPQFEVGPEKVGKGGIVKNEMDRQAVVGRIQQFAERLGLSPVGLIKSPITGTHGNIEFLAHWKS